ncbi:cation transporter [Psychrobium sp. 1_MG-2023]|uniref:cation transporter n=1 Tax=Psychrobium sp. 1_MG-2023 TaxID=3062624 RepID=UPI000C32970D|nr:cation diffusion facilitator family transporter [Psychrobium sp. 1_MG-2023]MDP2562931.1 cation diffusion facilitator family transporter [Psychrobium sp. 1_MG-2023]PKF54699.1 cation transporter [Alteromonadales bacterium alter-6D02]
MAGCCGHNKNFDGMSAAYKRILLWIIAINASMFFVEMSAGISAQSQALQADALDFLGDTFTYGLSLWVIGKSIAVRSNAAIFKGISLFVIAAWVFGSTVYRIFVLNSPDAYTMGTIAMLAFVANVVSVVLLRKYKDGDANVRSVWLCSRNDAIGNLVVVAAASGVWYTGTAWADLAVALILASLFFSSAWQILRQAIAEKRQPVCAE